MRLTPSSALVCTYPGGTLKQPNPSRLYLDSSTPPLIFAPVFFSCRTPQGGYAEIIKAIEKLGEKHAEHIAAYGEVCSPSSIT